MLTRSLRALVALAILLGLVAPAWGQAGPGTVNVLTLLNAQGSTTASQKGVLTMGAVTTSAPSYTNAQTSPLSIDTAGNLRVVTTGSSGLSVTDSATWTAASSAFTPSGGEYNPTAAALTSGQQGTLALTANRAQLVNVRDSAGQELGTRLPGTGNTPVQVTVAPSLPVIPPTLASADARAVRGGMPTGPTVVMLSDGAQIAEIKKPLTTASVNDRALVVTQSPIPSLQCPFLITINQTASTRLVTNPGGRFAHVCTFSAVSASAQNVSLIAGTGSTCATSGTGYIGGTTASVALAANGGLHGVSDKITIPMQKAGDDLCLLQSAAGNVSGTLTYGLY